MKTAQTVLGVVILLFIGGIALLWTKLSPVPNTNNQSNQGEESILGCYAVTNSVGDRYTLNIGSQQGSVVSGGLEFYNYQKDSSIGTFNGLYKNGILLADYSFRSEGMDSVMQVAFKRSGNDFIRGYGPLNDDGTRFIDVDSIVFDPSSTMTVFKKGECANTSSSVTFPKGGESLVRGQKYTISWSGGQDPTQIFLIDTSLKSAGASVSIADRVYNVKNTGSYEYTVPKTLKPGTYELQVGNGLSKTFSII